MTDTTAAPTGHRQQPISTVEWVDRNELQANDYNPNHVAPPELRLLKLSILENGWTQPIVVRQAPGGYEIVDGYHRWTVAADPDIAQLTGGLIPIVTLPQQLDAASQRMATIRHNRARGTHHVVKMADIVAQLTQNGVTDQEISRRLGMDDEEVSRLKDYGQMTVRGSADQLTAGWTPGTLNQEQLADRDSHRS